jgi:hypothetical protein
VYMMRNRRSYIICGSIFLSWLWLLEVDHIKHYLPRISDDYVQQDLIDVIALNPNSTVANDISSIWHNHRDNAICLQWSTSARCPHPSLVGRLSGPGLAVLEWQLHQSQDDESIVYCGSYKNSWLLPGTYFVELTIIHCNDFGVGAMKRLSQSDSYMLIRDSMMSETNTLQFDFSNKCLENPENNRITAKSASIVVPKEVLGKGESSKGHWVMLQSSGSQQQQPLYTRYQPQGCRGTDLPDYCKVAMNNTPKEAFSFVFREGDFVDETMAALQTNLTHMISEKSMAKNKDLVNWDIHGSVLDLEMKVHGITRAHNTRDMGKFDATSKVESMRGRLTEGPKVCIVGYSHSYHLIHAFYVNNVGHRFIWAPATTPDHLTAKFFEDYTMKRNCTKFIVAVAQWALGANVGKAGPWKFDRWSNELRRVSQLFLSTGRRNDTQLYFRSIHRLPIGDYIGQCGPKDWRSPTVIDAYNHIIEKVVQDSNHRRVQFLDTRFITNPLWDTAYDWNHVAPLVSQHEAAYIALRVLV